MNRWQQWFTPRGHPGGLSSNVGMVGGLVLFVTALTGGIGAVQLERVHAALAQAAQVAAQSEQQNGCWTESTTQGVYHVLKGAGINPGSVSLTADTASSTSYGGAVTAGLATKVGISVLGAKLMQIPIAAGANATSFYTPATAGGSNAACITPATCPTVTTMVQKTTPGYWTTVTGTTQQCTPTSRNVCGPVSSQQCGYHSQEEYTCTPVQSCDPVTVQMCVPDWSTDTVQCFPRTTTSCTTNEQCGYRPVSVYGCSTVTTTQCSTQTTQSCKTVPTTKQVWVPSSTTSTPVTTSVCG